MLLQRAIRNFIRPLARALRSLPATTKATTHVIKRRLSFSFKSKPRTQNTSTRIRHAFTRIVRPFSRAMSTVPTTHGVLQPNKPLKLTCGGYLPSSSIHIHYATWGDKSKPKILIAPSMSNSCFVTDHPDIPTKTQYHGGLWWQNLVGSGDQFAIDINKYHVISFTPLGSPFGSTSATTRITPDSDNPSTYAAAFPAITPIDQAKFIRMGLDALGITDKLHCIIGGSMGGMQVLEYAAQFPDTYSKICAIATTGWTSPSTVALRSIQRRVVRMDPDYKEHGINGHKASLSVLQGLLITRMIGTICYRSRTEFDDRFDWNLVDDDEDEGKFEVENYLQHQGNKFAEYYDANCYLALSYCMDRMNLGFGFGSFEDGVLRIPNDKDIMLLSYDTDYLIPPSELGRLSAILGARQNSKVYYEMLHSNFGHDTFLIANEMKQLDYRIKPFLESDGVTAVENVVTHELQ